MGDVLLCVCVMRVGEEGYRLDMAGGFAEAHGSSKYLGMGEAIADPAANF